MMVTFPQRGGGGGGALLLNIQYKRKIKNYLKSYCHRDTIPKTKRTNAQIKVDPVLIKHTFVSLGGLILSPSVGDDLDFLSGASNCYLKRK